MSDVDPGRHVPSHKADRLSLESRTTGGKVVSV